MDIDTIAVSLTRVQEKALIQYAIIRIREEKMESEVDKEIAKMHEDNELTGLQDIGQGVAPTLSDNVKLV